MNMRFTFISLFLILFYVSYASTESEIEVDSRGSSVNNEVNVFLDIVYLNRQNEHYQCKSEYKVPTMKCSLEFLETFQGDSNESGKWIYSYHREYASQSWIWGYGFVKPTLECDKSLITEVPASKYGITSFFDKPIDNWDKDFILQYEVRFQKGLECGGAYLKILRDGTIEVPEDLTESTPYVLMFGPDYCGTTNRVHLIIPHYNPISGEWEEKKLVGGPQMIVDTLTHLYTLIIRRDGSVEILIDQINKFTGTLRDDFQPPFSTPAVRVNPFVHLQTIPDPNDHKPADWVDKERIIDPTDVKPEDWDETQPKYIPDESAVKPTDWLDDEPLQIPDPTVEIPEDWDEEEYGPFEAPMIENPRCQEVSGCGVWERPMILNPLYRGPYTYRTIPNPAYKGPWFPRLIPNPAYYEEKHPERLPVMKGVAIEIWTLQEGIAFDNILITHDERCAEAFADATFRIKRQRELEEHPEIEKRKYIPRAENEPEMEPKEEKWVGKRRARMSLAAYVNMMIDKVMQWEYDEKRYQLVEWCLIGVGISGVVLIAIVYYKNRDFLQKVKLVLSVC